MSVPTISSLRISNGPALLSRFKEVFLRTWDLGFTAFGGPPVHFQILHRRFVDDAENSPWIDEQTYQELFAVSQALPGPASTKMAFSIAHTHAGLVPAILFFFIWSLPGALGMFGLALGIQRVGAVLPDPVYALLSGINAATVGIIALAAVQLSKKAITDRLTRALVVASGCAGLCYNALWYLPTLMVVGGCSTVAWDCWMEARIREIKAKLSRGRNLASREVEENSIQMEPSHHAEQSTVQHRHISASSAYGEPYPQERQVVPAPAPAAPKHGLPVKWGILTIFCFFVSFIALMVLRGVLKNPPRSFSLFTNMYLAGTVIFGGGPVVIPLLREYVVQPGWVSPRDFLLGLALIQAFPGPNFNFSVYLGGLSLSTSSTTLGAVLAFFGIFLPGITLSVGFQSVWRALRRRRFVVSGLRGVNAAAVGLVFTAVYRLWQIGYLTPTESSGVSLANEPWWLVISVVTYASVEWYGTVPPVAIMGGGVAGLGWWGAVARQRL
ncbi:chromate transporter-domain-containing protein [Mycena metata]|uniref:Chromate transporter-domain-containing protein n=1 Tax=Mycena metata TaxID=1033252 RepID=A0AAD7JQW2_9AGAR|nr:chromate transporter-domain-containing protein [Mycena metata]